MSLSPALTIETRSYLVPNWKHKLAESEKRKHEVARSTSSGVSHSSYRGRIKVIFQGSVI